MKAYHIAAYLVIVGAVFTIANTVFNTRPPEVIAFKTADNSTVASVDQRGVFHLTGSVSPEDAAEIAYQSLGWKADVFCKESAQTSPFFVYTVLLEGADAAKDGRSIDHVWSIGLTPDGGVKYEGGIPITADEERFFDALSKRIACVHS